MRSKAMLNSYAKVKTMERRYKGEGSIRKKGNIYEGRIYVKINGKSVRRSVYARTKAECVKKMVRSRLTTEPISDLPASPSLREWLPMWIDKFKAGTSFATKQKYKVFCKQIYAQPFSRKTLREITPLEIQQFINSYQSYDQASRCMSMLKAAWDTAIANNYADRNILYSVTNNVKKEVKLSRDSDKVMSIEEQIAFEKAIIGNKYRPLYLIALYAGLRRGEVCALTWEDINFKRNEISVTKSSSRQGVGYSIGATKTKNSVRYAPLSNTLKELLLPYKSKGYIAGKEINADILTMDFKAIMRSLNLPHHFHTLRHTFTTRCAEKGIPTKIIQLWLGHANPEMTSGTYTHATDQAMKNAIKSL